MAVRLFKLQNTEEKPLSLAAITRTARKTNATCCAAVLRPLRRFTSHSHASAEQTALEAEPSGAPPAFELPKYCSGCGVKLQMEDPDAPGFFQLPKRLFELAEVQRAEDSSALQEPTASSVAQEDDNRGHSSAESPDTQAGTESAERIQDDRQSRGLSSDFALKQQLVGEEEEEAGPRILCARCYSLQNYGKVKSALAESSLPAFDLGRKVGRKMALQKFRRPVVLCVVDLADFDGSLPREALRSILPSSMLSPLKERQAGSSSAKDQSEGWQPQQKSGLDECRLILVANKADLLPPQASITRLQGWIHKRAQQAGFPKLDAVHLVSSTKRLGISDLLQQVQKLAGLAGDVWVVGAQNAGKSSLINAMRRAVGHKSSKRDVTTAALPGTTLGLLRIDGVLRERQRMFDTPGVPHSHQLSSRLSADEVRLLLPRGRLKPRSFRIAAGQCVFVGGVFRLDVVSSSAKTLYFTVWASSDIPCHFGKTERAQERYFKMAGTALIPPLGNENRLKELGPLLPADLDVRGSSFKSSSTDVAVAGLGWVGIALAGDAHLKAWTHKGIAATVRDALVPDLAAEMERPGLGNRTRSAPRVAKK